MSLDLTRRSINITAEILNILAKNKCTIAEAYRITGGAADYYKSSAIVQERDFLAELNERFAGSIEED